MAEETYGGQDARALDLLTEEQVAAKVADLGERLRRRRQDAAHMLALSAQQEGGAELLIPHVDALVEALEVKEAQTRWEVLTALAQLALVDAALVEDAFEGAEDSLFDEDSAIARLAAFRFLVRLGISSPERSERVWKLLDEAIQCYHGDPEYRAMLVALLEFAAGDLSDDARAALIARVGFDAQNASGELKAMSSEIVAVAKGGHAQAGEAQDLEASDEADGRPDSKGEASSDDEGEA